MGVKGSAYEREFCKKLSRWWTGGAREDVFWRSQNSGGRAKVRSYKNLATAGQYGDVAATDPVGAPLLRVATFELKRGYAQTSWHDLLDGGKGGGKGCDINDWVKKAWEDRYLARSHHWILILRRDKKPEMALMPQMLANELRAACGVNLEAASPVHAKLRIDRQGACFLFGLPWEVFLGLVEPDDILTLESSEKRRYEYEFEDEEGRRRKAV